jgi:hypothetical protein
MAKAVLHFAIYRGDAFERREAIAQDIVKVGKDPKSHLRIDDDAASRMHAVIEVGGPEDITLIDLGNDPGTMVNGARVNKCKLHVGDRIEIGDTLIMLEAAEDIADAPVAAAPAPQMPRGAVASNPFAAAGGSNPFAAGGAPFAAAPSNPFGGGAPNPFGAGQGRFGSAPPPPQQYYQQHGHGHGVADDAPEGTYTYQLIKSGPDVSSDEVETHAQAVEVMVLWGSNVLHVSHLAPPRNFYVGEELGKNFSTDFFIPSEKLGTTRMPVVIADAASISVVIPPGATGTIEIPGQPRMSLDEVRHHAQACAEMSGAQQISIGSSGRARIELNDFVFQIAAVNAGKPIKHGVGAGIDWNVALYFAASFLGVGGFIAAMAFFVPPLGLTDDEDVDKNALYLMQQFLDAAAERELEEKETEQVTEQDADNKEGGTGTRAKGEEGSMGKQDSKATNKRYAVQGPQDNPDPHIARQAALREAMEFGMIGLLNTGAAGDPNAPTAPWGRDTSLGTDSVSAMGNMFGDEIGDAYGAGGLGLSGIGEGGGGRGEGIGLGSIGTLGHGAGTGTGQGFGSGHGRLGGSHATKAPKVRMGATTVSGRLPPEVIQRIVRQNYGRFRMCYEQGLARNPNLEGRVQVRFVIGRDGSVSNVSNGGSDIPDSAVVQCVIRNYYGLSFPQPEGGIVTVVYPIMFSPG